MWMTLKSFKKRFYRKDLKISNLFFLTGNVILYFIICLLSIWFFERNFSEKTFWLDYWRDTLHEIMFDSDLFDFQFYFPFRDAVQFLVKANAQLHNLWKMYSPRRENWSNHLILFSGYTIALTVMRNSWVYQIWIECTLNRIPREISLKKMKEITCNMEQQFSLSLEHSCKRRSFITVPVCNQLFIEVSPP